MAYKVRFIVWQEEGMSTTAVANCSGRHCTSIKCLLTEAKTSARRPSLREINGMLTIKKRHALKGLNFVKCAYNVDDGFR